MKFYKLLIISLFFTSFSYADIRSEFPSYSYVLTEFDVDERFIDNAEFKNFVHKNKREYTKRYINAVKRGGLIIPTIKEMMYQKDISPVFLYIAMVESAFDPEAVSRTGAGGLWQFTVNTGTKEFNLHVGKTLDERYDPIRATDSAIKYLYKINNNLNSWYLTTMAYNCGNGCVNRSLKKAGTRDLGTLISSRNGYIKAETRKYIQKVLLMAMIGENYLFKSNDNLGEMMYTINKDSITPVNVRSGESLVNLSKILNMNTYYLEKINAHLKNGKVPHRHGYKINIPTSKVGMFYNRYTQNIQPARTGYLKYAQR
ncbi:MAG: Membrane-bound lytic murein transglycosylase D [uncultured Sulfurovum sp.]|uniref:Membrane-bound lytic murein transglycosylase D n=1 Tax=uncultured Sulfurovum sp. TaxID=269237 RepID=A0A6S6SMS7_9BACT|nr:MAG: Membrane-bound lytic murein transglycosylase D [uncultured Sulfurovum sp.]